VAFAGIRAKIEAYAHQENNVKEHKDKDYILNSIKEGNDLFKRGAPHGELKPNAEVYDLPRPILEDVLSGEGKYSDWLPELFEIDVYKLSESAGREEL